MAHYFSDRWENRSEEKGQANNCLEAAQNVFGKGLRGAFRSDGVSCQKYPSYKDYWALAPVTGLDGTKARVRGALLWPSRSTHASGL